MIKATIFDMDGLMFDTESAYSIVQSSLSKKRGKVFTHEIKRTLMGKKADEVMHLLNTFWGKNERIEDLLKEQDKELINVYKGFVEKRDGLDELIAFLDQNHIRKCIATSSRRFLADILLEKHKLTDTFEFIVSGDMIEKGKPDPEIYHQCLAKLNVSGRECLVLEDSLNGIKAAIAAGCNTCAVVSEYTKDIDFLSATLVCSSLRDQAIRNFILR
ncbi:MAG: HAD family phosphatase [Planctomycetes bacterium]|nr:HAD family phosphatase [Planctomycetota bacterium]